MSDWTPTELDFHDGKCICCDGISFAYGPRPEFNETFDTEFQSAMCLTCGAFWLLIGEEAIK